MSIYVIFFFNYSGSGQGVGFLTSQNLIKAKAMCCCQTRWGQTPRRGDKQRREKENVFCLPTEQRARLGLKLSNPLRRLPYSQPSLCVQVQRESKCERPKQTLKASWVGVKGWRDGQAAGRRKADIREKPRQLSVLVPKGQEGPRTQTVLSGQIWGALTPPNPAWALIP